MAQKFYDRPSRHNHFTGAQAPRWSPVEKNRALRDIRVDAEASFSILERDRTMRYAESVFTLTEALGAYRTERTYLTQNEDGTAPPLAMGKLGRGQAIARPVWFSDFDVTKGFGLQMVDLSFDNAEARLEIETSLDAAAAGAVTVGGTQAAQADGAKAASGDNEHIPCDQVNIPQLLTPGVNIVNNGNTFVLAGMSNQFGDLHHTDVQLEQLDYILDLEFIGLSETALDIVTTLGTTNLSSGAKSSYWGLTDDLDNVAAAGENWAHVDTAGTEAEARVMALLALNLYEAAKRTQERYPDATVTVLYTAVDNIIKALIEPDDAGALALRWDATLGYALATQDFDATGERGADGTYWTDPDYPMNAFYRNYLNAIIGGIAVDRGVYTTKGAQMLDHVATDTTADGGWAYMLAAWAAASMTGAPPWWEAWANIYGYAVGRSGTNLRDIWLAMEATASNALPKDRPFGTTTVPYEMGFTYIDWLLTYVPDMYDPPNNGGAIGDPMDDTYKWPQVNYMARNMALAMYAAYRFQGHARYGMFVRGMADALLVAFGGNQGGQVPDILQQGTLYQNNAGPGGNIVIHAVQPFLHYAFVMQVALDMAVEA